MRQLLTNLCLLAFLGAFTPSLLSQKALEPMDIFHLEYISDPQISPDGKQIAYVRNSMDIQKDRSVSQIWISDIDGKVQRPLSNKESACYSPRWSPDGTQLVYLSDGDKGVQLYLKWMDTGHERRLSNFSSSPGSISWSPDGKFLAFQMSVPNQTPPFVQLPKAPAGAKWAATPQYIDKVRYKADGAGFLKDQQSHLFVMSVDGGYARQLTEGSENHSGPYSWSIDGQFIYFSANLNADKALEPANSEIYRIHILTQHIDTLTQRKGPDRSPEVSPDGNRVAYTGYDETYMGYQQSHLYIMDADGKNPRWISKGFERDVNQVQWSADGKSLYFTYDSEGKTHLGTMNMSGRVDLISNELGGLSLGRPYAGASYSLAKNGNVAFTLTSTEFPSELAVYQAATGKTKRLTFVNEDLFSNRLLGEVEEIWYPSSYDGRQIQGWICKPPGFDPSKKYPLILEIHGGPFLNYGPRFAMEIQLFAAAGYVVLYTNPRGSTSYGSEFANLIHHNYPSQDYDDLISGVDAVIEKGYIDDKNLFVTGGSGGGVLTAWIIGKTDRFAAAVVAKPVINWSSFVLHADGIDFFARYWFGKYPWEDIQAYWDRSPLSLVGNVKTPTMVLTGEQDYRTPMSETEQYYAALKLQQVDAAMVRIQEAGHGITNRPSNLIHKVAYIMAWFDKYKQVD